jgi:dTDP-4-dehydrorhamnose 3,5-epimerase
MKIEKTTLNDVVIISPDVFADERGSFFESFNAEKFAALGLPTDFKQDNQSTSKAGVLRGLHFQLPPYAMGKLVRCSRGRIWDVGVDLRKNSSTFKQWFGVELSASNQQMLWLPPGIAHGFYALTDCEVVYKCTATFNKDADANVAWNDPAFNITWPLIDGASPLLSPRDAAAPAFATLDLPF